MNSRERILDTVRKNQPTEAPLQEMVPGSDDPIDKLQKFIDVLEGIGGKAIRVRGWDEIDKILKERFSAEKRWVNLIPELPDVRTRADYGSDPHLLEDVALTVLKGHFGVAENGATWITEELMGDRALPFICEHLALVIPVDRIHATMYDAYQYIDQSQYNFGTFIAGPSKTADIEQSLVLGAHGPKSLTVFLRSGI